MESDEKNYKLSLKDIMIKTIPKQKVQPSREGDY